MNFRLKIVDDTTTYTPWAAEYNGAVTQAVQQARFAYPAAAISVQHQTSAPVPPPTYSGTMKLSDDLNPTLGGDLDLNGHAILGTLDGGQL